MSHKTGKTLSPLGEGRSVEWRMLRAPLDREEGLCGQQEGNEHQQHCAPSHEVHLKNSGHDKAGKTYQQRRTPADGNASNEQQQQPCAPRQDDHSKNSGHRKAGKTWEQRCTSADSYPGETTWTLMKTLQRQSNECINETVETLQFRIAAAHDPYCNETVETLPYSQTTNSVKRDYYGGFPSSVRIIADVKRCYGENITAVAVSKGKPVKLSTGNRHIRIGGHGGPRTKGAAEQMDWLHDDVKGVVCAGICVAKAQAAGKPIVIGVGVAPYFPVCYWMAGGD